MHGRLTLYFAAMLGALAFTRLARAEPNTATRETNASRITEIGRAQYTKYCTACHGAAGKGDGTVADALKPRPADLTHIATRRHGAFPAAQVEEIIDGRKIARAQGARVMPIWGEQLAQNLPQATQAEKERLIANRIKLITAYLRSIQVAD
jgi:mono/diheme cytochrome c family protein